MGNICIRKYFDSLEMQQQFPETAEKIIAN